MGKSKKPIGIVDGRLTPCPKSPNCVSTHAKDEKHKFNPIKYTGSIDEAKERILDIIKTFKRTKVITDTENYVHIEFRTATFKFVDDVEFLFDDNQKEIHFRSAARLGYSDMGVNRKRMKQITTIFLNP